MNEGYQTNQSNDGMTNTQSPQPKRAKNDLKTIKEAKISSATNKRIHPVTGYSDFENMWQKIGNLEKDLPHTNKYPNKRSQFII